MTTDALSKAAGSDFSESPDLQATPSDSSAVPVSVVVLAKNEEQNIGRCLQALSWADEVVVIDDGSTDQTAEIARQNGGRVLQHTFQSFAQQRNWAIDHAQLRNEWILHLDADEVATPELRIAVERAISTAADDVVAFRMCRKTMLMDKWLKYSDGFPVWIMRLVRKRRAYFQDQGHGEVAVPDVDGQMETIREPFLHYAFSKGLTDWIDRHNRYSTREALLELQTYSGLKWKNFFNPDRAIRRAALRSLSRRLPFRPWIRFFYQYVLKRGFLDGRAGWTFSRMMAMYEGWIVMKREEMRRERRGQPSAEQRPQSD